MPWASLLILSPRKVQVFDRARQFVVATVGDDRFGCFNRDLRFAHMATEMRFSSQFFLEGLREVGFLRR